MQKNVDVLTVKDSQKFEVHCRAGDAGELCVGAESVSVKVGQRLEGMGAKKFGIQSESMPRKRKTAPSSFKFWFSIPIGMKHCKLQASSRGRWMQIAVRVLGATWTM